MWAAIDSSRWCLLALQERLAPSEMTVKSKDNDDSGNRSCNLHAPINGAGPLNLVSAM